MEERITASKFFAYLVLVKVLEDLFNTTDFDHRWYDLTMEVTDVTNYPQGSQRRDVIFVVKQTSAREWRLEVILQGDQGEGSWTYGEVKVKGPDKFTTFYRFNAGGIFRASKDGVIEPLKSGATFAVYPK